jgi:hypothetical protein
MQYDFCYCKVCNLYKLVLFFEGETNDFNAFSVLRIKAMCVIYFTTKQPALMVQGPRLGLLLGERFFLKTNPYPLNTAYQPGDKYCP